jgi:hypothetical protein
MCACIAQLRREQQHNMAKLLASWRSEQVVSPGIIAACEDKLPDLAAAAHGHAAHDTPPAAHHHHHHHHGAAADAASPQPGGAANGGYSGSSQYVQAMAAAAVAAAAQAAQAKQLTPAKRVRLTCFQSW